MSTEIFQRNGSDPASPSPYSHLTPLQVYLTITLPPLHFLFGFSFTIVKKHQWRLSDFDITLEGDFSVKRYVPASTAFFAPLLRTILLADLQSPSFSRFQWKRSSTGFEIEPSVYMALGGTWGCR